jgi:POT family proton-dependent oligopeptide transporter
MIQQPRGVFWLSFTEMWERFSFYSIQAILVLYAAAGLGKGGLGWSEKEALFISGLYGAAVYTTPALGGMLADKYFGSKRSVALGGILMCLGHFLMAIRSEILFFVSLTLLCLGCGLLKPCITSMVGECYPKSDKRQEAGFTFFYMAINFGGFIGSFASGALSDFYGFHMAFAAAGIGLLIGLVHFYFAGKHSLKEIGNKIPKLTFQERVRFVSLTPIEKRRMYIFMFLCVVNIVWNVVYGLSYGLLTLYAENNVQRSLFGFQIPATWFYGMYSVFLVLFSPFLAAFYQKVSKKKNNLTINKKLCFGYLTAALACLILLPMVVQISHNHHAQVSSIPLILFYVIFAISELVTLPALLSAATTMSPKSHGARMVSFNLVVSWSFGAWIAGILSGLTVSVGATSLFVGLILCCLVFAIFHKLFDKKCEQMCHDENLSEPWTQHPELIA